MISCGKKFLTERAALASRKGQTRRYLAISCRLCSYWHLRRHRAEPKRRASGAHAIPRKVCRQVDKRDTWNGTRCCVKAGCGKPGLLHRHHRRIKGAGGDPRAHTDCACNIVTLCGEHHEWAHRNRREAEAEGLIISAEVTEPGLHPVMVGTENSGVTAWPTCDGRWITEAPAARGAAA